MKPLFLFAAGILLLSACASEGPLCPADSTADFDVAITQIAGPDVHLWPVATEELPTVIPTPTMRLVPTAYVEYAVDVINRTGTPVRLKQIRLETPRVDRHHPQAVCFGVESVPAPIEKTSRAIDKLIPAEGRGRVFMKVLQYGEGDSMARPPQVIRARIGLQTDRGARYEFLNRRIMLVDAAAQAVRPDSDTRRPAP